MDQQERRKRWREYYAKKRDKILAYNKAWQIAKRREAGIGPRNPPWTAEKRLQDQRERARRYREQHPEKAHEYYARNIETIAEQARLRGKQKRRATGIGPRNKPQSREQKNAKERERRKRLGDTPRSPEAVKRAKTKYAKSPRGRAQLIVNNQRRRARVTAAVGTFTVEQIAALFLQQGKRCPACGIRISDKPGIILKFHIDHVMPLSKGGSNWIENIQLLCPKCNIRKKDKHPDEWAAENGLLFC